ncbi:hypothetical protein KDAU_45230 [Dictyobacter aurantiacus]|uniref:Uncharacterized protein n=1 Tax=Dictyobacter aurantiacus TaxID=1936993 RepID=A0A401ZK51_9CHLR|nr:hypothetical protein KDAU_45230 [Dictyobacter aurantiacus]
MVKKTSQIYHPARKRTGYKTNIKSDNVGSGLAPDFPFPHVTQTVGRPSWPIFFPPQVWETEGHELMINLAICAIIQA